MSGNEEDSEFTYDWTRSRNRSSSSASPDEAIAEAIQHARGAVSEAVKALGCVIDATAQATTSNNSNANEWLGMAQRALESLGNALDERPKPEAAYPVDAILDALDNEITRWQEKAEQDSEARSVLRAYLGVREILWEFGLRRSVGENATDEPAESAGEPVKTPKKPAKAAEPKKSEEDEIRKKPRSKKKSARPKRGRVQRVQVKG